MDAPTPPADDAPRARLGLADHAAFLVLLAPYLLLVRRFWFVTDDAYITFRYARNLARGLGPIFNVGEHPPTEGYSNFLWMLVVALVERLGLNVEIWPNVVSAALGVLFLYLVLRVLRLRLGLSLLVSLCALALLALHPPFAVYSTSGLETMAFNLLLFVSFELLILRRGGVAPLAAGLALAATAMTRVSGLYWGLALLPLAAFSRALAGERVLKPLAKAYGVLVIVYGSYWLWRFSYYEQLFPNTVYAKAGLTAARLDRGVDYVLVNLMSQLTLFASALGVPFALRRERRAIGLPVAAMALAPYAYAVLVTGDFMTFGRFLLPAFPFTTILFAWALDDLRAGRGVLPQLLPAAAFFAVFYLRILPAWAAVLALAAWVGLTAAGRRLPRARTASMLALAAFAVWVGVQPAFDHHFVRRKTRMAHHFRWNGDVGSYRSEYDQWYVQCHNTARWGCLGRALKRWAPPDAKVVHGAIGAVSYYSDLFLYDKNGLTSREVAMRDYVDGPLSSPGHDKTVELDFFLNDPRFQPTILKSRLLDALAGVEEGVLVEELARMEFVRQVRSWETELRGMRLQDRFVTDFRPVPDWEYGGPWQYLVWWRALGPGEDALAYRTDLEHRIAEFLEGRDPYRDVVEEGWPQPLVRQTFRRRGAGDDEDG